MAETYELATGYVSLAVSTQGLGSDIARQFGAVEKQADSSGKKAGRSLGGGLLAGVKGIAGPVAALFAAGEVVNFFKEANDEARESQKVGAVTTQVIKATGGAAKISADQVGDLATAISNKTGMDDEAIQSGANLLLTFKNVRNEAGKGSKIFDRATAAAADLSAAGFGSVEGSSKMLGKALNDPLKGISALGRAGVTFTDQQKKQIKTLVESGKTLEAQKIILGEVEGQVGGVAAASATAGEKLATSFGNFKEQAGTALLPVLDRVYGFLNDKIIPAMSDGVDFIETKVAPAFSKVGDVVKTVFNAVNGKKVPKDGPLGTVANIARGIRDVFAEVKPYVTTFFDAITGKKVAADGPLAKVAAIAYGIRDAFAAGVEFITTQVVPAYGRIIASGQKLGAVVLPIVKAIIGALVREWPKIKPVVMETFEVIKGIITNALGIVKAIIDRFTQVISFIWSRWGDKITAYVTRAFSMIAGIIRGAMNIIGGVVKTVLGIITGDWSKAGEGIKQIGRGLRQVLVAVFGDMWKKIKDAFRTGVSAVKSIWSRIQDVAKAPVRFVINTVINDGLIGAYNKLAGFIGVAKIAPVALPKGFYTGGSTGNIDPRRIAGVVHGNEHVATAAEVAKTPGGHKTWELMRGLIRKGVYDWLPGTAAYFLGGGVQPVPGHGNRHRGYPWARWAGDFPVGMNTPVHAYKAGVVSAVKYLTTSYGRHVRINHGGERTLYAHLNSIRVRPGQRVDASQVIGLSGSTGNSTGPHVHFELAGGSGPIDTSTGGVIKKVAEYVKAGFSSFAGWFKSLIAKPLAQLNGLSGFGQLAGGIPKLLASGMAKKFDTGGLLRPGLTLAYNGTGRDERVRTYEQEQALGGMLANHLTIQGYTAAEVARAIDRERRAKEARSTVQFAAA